MAANARIERMLRELNSEPPVQFFEGLFGLVGLGETVQEAAPIIDASRVATAS